MGEEEILKIFKTYSDVFKLDTMIARTIRELLWGIVKILGYIVDSISTITDKLFVLDRFYNDPKVIDFTNSVKPLIAVLFAISLLGIGYQLMFSQTKQFKKIGTNILVAIAVILVLPMAMNKMNTLTNIGVKAVKGEPNDITNQIIKSNIVDLVMYDKLNFNKDDIKKLKSPNTIDINAIRQIDSTSIIETGMFDTLKLQNKDVFKKKIGVDKDGKLKSEDLNQGWLTFWKEYYYRFDINFLNIILSLGVLGATLAFTCFKLARLIFELGYNKFLAILIAPTDIADGQKTKQILQNIMSTFIVTFLIATLLKFYMLFVGMCAGIKGIEGVILLVAGSFAVIDGPNLVEKLFGIDAGLRSGFKTMAGAYMVGKTAMGGAKSIGKTSKNIAGGVGKIAGGAIGASAGIASGLNDKKRPSLHEDMARDKAKKTADANKGKSIYPDMAKRNENLGKEDPINSSTENTGNSNKKNGASSPEADSKKGSDNPMYTENPSSNSLYKEIKDNNNTPEPINSSKGTESGSNGENGVSGHIASNNTPEPIQHTPSNNGNGINGQPSTNGNISNNTPEPINGSKGTESSSNGENGVSGHIASNNTPEPIQHTPSDNGNGINRQPNINGNISNNIPEPINSSKGTESSNNVGNEVSGHITPKPIQTTPSSNGMSGKPTSNNISEPVSNNGSGHIAPNNIPETIQSNNDNSPYQTIGQYQKEKIVNKFQNNPIVKQTVESYKRGKNTGQGMRENINNKNK
ncbi:hypothetical protein LGL08_22180 [Clostridium estertheticum]|uniref:pLS20_p028 family conjugation system transmembrane protein n=1 Tax=Clostridium estertheticum TaxID=238834 RepID=UPI001CF140AF|nr:hypothetical protein [Clostridium estertheticum]MCB2352234.1 hypothetical protein [Clostridium estertheticum]